MKDLQGVPGMQGEGMAESRLLGNLLANLDGLVYRCLIDDDWTMQFLSQGCEALTGYPAEDLLPNGRLSYEALTHPDDRARVRKAIHAALEDNRRFDMEYRIVRRDGELRWVWERGIGIKGPDGTYVALEGFIQDITQRKEAERRFRQIFEHAVEGIFQSTPDEGYLVANPALARMYGYASPEEMIVRLRDIGRRLYVEPDRRNEFLRLMAENGMVVNFESQVYRSDGSIIWISENARTVCGPDDKFLCFEGTVTDITERKNYEAWIRHQASHDALTGLPNRNLLQDRVQQAIVNAHRRQGIVAVLFIDLDQFKYINDSLGHQIGDELLKVVASRLTSCVRAGDTVARHGGDEFVVVLEDHRNSDTVTGTVQRILEAVAEPWLLNGLELLVTCSVGIALYPDDGQDAQALMRHADSAMYRAKDLGRNSFEYFAAEMSRHAGERLDILNSLRHAITDDEFLLHYQPRVDLASGRIIGAEALIRWNSATRGMVPPGDFIPLAEDSGLIFAIGEWVLRTACAQNVAWQRAGLAPIPVSVNLSPRQLVRGDIVSQVARVLASTGLEPCWLELEITETVVMRDVEKSLHMLRELKKLGVRISIDDFGTGYSSLNYLKRFPVDTLKIDRSFVNDIAADAEDAAIVKAVIALARILKLRVVAEGVETSAQRSFLEAHGCDEGQGYYFGRPMAHADFARLAAQS